MISLDAHDPGCGAGRQKSYRPVLEPVVAGHRSCPPPYLPRAEGLSWRAFPSRRRPWRALPSVDQADGEKAIPRRLQLRPGRRDLLRDAWIPFDMQKMYWWIF